MSKIKQIEAILIDCDGTLTSGGVTYSETGERQKTFHSRDIPAIKQLMSFGFRVMIVSQSKWQGVKYFAERCGCEYYTGVADKLEFVQKKGIDPGKCIVFTDSMDDNGIVRESYVAYVPKDGNFYALCNTRTLNVNGGCGVVDYFISQCIVRHESRKGGVNMMVLIFNGDEITPAPVSKKTEHGVNCFATEKALFDKHIKYATLLELFEATNNHSDKTGDGEKIKRLYLGLDDAPYPNYAKGGVHAEPDHHDFCANARANDMSNAEIGMAKEIEHLREENRGLRESNERLRKENQKLQEWNDKLNECCNLLESEVQMLKAKIFDIQNK